MNLPIMINFPSLLMTLLLLITPQLLSASDVNNLYEASVRVADQGQAERNRAIRDAFVLVLVKVTGSREIPSLNSLRGELAKASSYVQQYRYQNDPQAEPAATTRLLAVSFDKIAVDRVLRDRGLPVWGRSRPRVLAWVGVERDGRRELLLPEFNPKLIKMLRTEAKRRGLPLILPMMDLEDQSALSATDLWGNFAGPVVEASSRYPHDAVLTLTLKPDGGQRWSGRWMLLDGEQQKNGQLSAKSLAVVLQNTMDATADDLAARYAPSGGTGAEQLVMQVDAVRGFADLLRLQQFLDAQETLQSYQVRAIQGERVIVTLSLRGGLQSFSQAMNLSGILVPDTGAGLVSGATTAPGADPAYSQSQAQALVETVQLYYALR